MKTFKTNIHYYSFPHSDGAGYNALWKEQVRRETQVCGYCGSYYGPHHEEHDDIPEEGFCTKCLSSEFLKDTELHLLRLLPVCDSSSAKRAPLTEEESAWLKLRYIDIQIEGNRQRAEGEKRAAIEEVTKKCNTAAIEYGGPAFPVPDSHHANGQVQYGANGMSLRDYFAGQALAGLVAHNDYGSVFDQDVADEAYRYADAMIAAREVKP